MFQKYQKNIRNNCTLNWVLGNDELFYEQNVVSYFFVQIVHFF